MKSTLFGLSTLLLSAFTADAGVPGGSFDGWRRYAAPEGGLPQSVVAVVQSADGGALWLTCGYSDAHPDLQVAVTAKGLLGQGVMPERLTLVRFDENRPQHQRWAYGPRAGGPADKESADLFLAGLSAAGAVEIQLADYRLNSTRLGFRLDPNETRAVIASLKRECRAVSAGR